MTAVVQNWARWKKVGRRLLYPGRILKVLIPLVSFSILISVFYFELPDSPVVYLSYVFAFYGLVVLVLGSIPLIRKSIGLYRKVKETGIFHISRSLVASLVINVCYGLFNMVSGMFYHSVWLLSTGAYYLILSLIRLVLVFYERRYLRSDDPLQKQRLGWQGFQICGVFMFLLNITMSGMVIQMVWEGKGSTYPEFVVYAVAAYTFYRLTTAIIRVVKSKGDQNPIHGAARNISLTAAIMSLYSLQTAMLSAFSDDAAYHFLMNSLSGCAVCVLVVLGALGMAIHGGKKKKVENIVDTEEASG